ncbi:unnamed protein product, partial [Rotaria sp. Silwood1]
YCYLALSDLYVVEDYVPIAIIANFKLVKRLTHDLQLIIDVLKGIQKLKINI